MRNPLAWQLWSGRLSVHGEDAGAVPPLEDNAPVLAEPLAKAVRWWRVRGYSVAYSDPRLVQVARQRAAPERDSLLIASAVMVAVGCLLFNLALRRQIWHVVTLTVTPDGRVITHRIWSRRAPRM